MAGKTFNLNDAVGKFFGAETVEVPHLGVSVCPATDLAFNRNEKTMYVYADGLWTVVDDMDDRTGDLAVLVDRFLLEHYPEQSPTTERINALKESVFRRTPMKFDSSVPSPFSVFSDASMDLSKPGFPVVPHSRSHFATHGFRFATSDVSMPTPAFDAYMARTFADPEERSLVMDMLGYYLTPFDEEPAFFYLYGPPRTGKSRLMNLMPKLIGERFVSSFSLQSLTTRLETVAELAGKRLNSLDEDESDRIQSDKFKALVDHSLTEARRLYQASYSYRPRTKFLFSSNQLPRFQNVEGLERRIHFVSFDRIIPKEDQDKSIDSRLEAEIPGIVGKALVAAQAFANRNGEFVDPASSVALKEEFLRSVVPARLFVDECCVILADEESSWKYTGNPELYKAYRAWCSMSGHKPFSSQNFHKQLLSIPGVEIRKSHGARQKNLTLKNPAMGESPIPPTDYGFV